MVGTLRMNTYKRHRFPADIISYTVWLYFGLNLSHRDIEDLLAQRGIVVSYETIRLLSQCHSHYLASGFSVSDSQDDE